MHFLAIFFIIIILGNSLNAKEFSVEYPDKSYTVKYDSKKIELKGYLTDLSLEKKECNKDIILELNNYIDRLIAKTTFYTNKINDIPTVKVTKEKNVYYLNAKNAHGKKILFLREKIQSQIIEEQILCSKLFFKNVKKSDQRRKRVKL